MKRIIGRILFISSMVFFFFSCTSVYRLSIDVQEPALITLPLDVGKVVIVNNTAVQPDSFGLERVFDGKDVSGYYPRLDSVAWVGVHAMSKTLDEANFFSKVAIYKESIRTDGQWLAKAPLSPEFRKDFFEKTDVDAIITIDQMLFRTVENLKTIQKTMAVSEIPIFADIRVDAKLSCSIFIENRQTPLTSFSIIDSSFYKSSFYTDSAQLLLLKQLPELIIQDLARKMGEDAGLHFIPSWKTVDRFIYTAADSRMKEATSYFKTKKWKMAETAWTQIYEEKGNPQDKARLALNIAVANEMQDKLDAAYSWAEKSKEFYSKINPDKNADEISQATEYMTSLRKRLLDNRLLDIQWGVGE